MPPHSGYRLSLIHPLNANSTTKHAEDRPGHATLKSARQKEGDMEDTAHPIRIAVINGSVRPRNYTSMASAYVVDELRKHPKVEPAVPGR